MTKPNNEFTERVSLSTEETNQLENRLVNNELTKKDIEILLSLLSFSAWVQERLSRAKLTIKRLNTLFGFKNESKKKNKNKKNSEKSNDSSNGSSDNTNAEENTEAANDAETSSQDKPENKLPVNWDASKNHGRYAASEYPGCQDIDVPMDDEHLKQSLCPECAACDTEAKVVPLPPKMIVQLESHPLVSGRRYCLEQSRCLLCLTYFKATLPEEAQGKKKYSPNCTSAIAIHHYYAGLPFKRIEMLQAAQGIPLADATQYDLMSRFYHSVAQPVMTELEKYAAEGSSLFFDDSSHRILEQIALNKSACSPGDKRSIHATAILSIYEGRRIYLFKTNTLPAGKQLRELLETRQSNDQFLTMSDASAQNFPELKASLLSRWIISLCLTHGRRRFVELMDEAHIDHDIVFVLDCFSQVYQHDEHCKNENLDLRARLEYHQKNSGPLMEALRIWMNNLLLYKRVEPNSSLGEALAYMLKRWEWLTQFLRTPGAALDNNLCEQAVKLVIRYRKNSLFYRTFQGANIGDAIMSLLHTAAHNNVNIFNYFNELQAHAVLVNESPASWLPWNYQETIQCLVQRQPKKINSG